LVKIFFCIKLEFELYYVLIAKFNIIVLSIIGNMNYIKPFAASFTSLSLSDQ